MKNAVIDVLKPITADESVISNCWCCKTTHNLSLQGVKQVHIAIYEHIMFEIRFHGNWKISICKFLDNFGLTRQ